MRICTARGIEPLCVSTPRELKSRPSTSLTHHGTAAVGQGPNRCRLHVKTKLMWSALQNVKLFQCASGRVCARAGRDLPTKSTQLTPSSKCETLPVRFWTCVRACWTGPANEIKSGNSSSIQRVKLFQCTSRRVCVCACWTGPTTYYYYLPTYHFATNSTPLQPGPGQAWSTSREKGSCGFVPREESNPCVSPHPVS